MKRFIKSHSKERETTAKAVKRISNSDSSWQAIRTLGLRPQVLSSGLSHRILAYGIKALVHEFGGIVIVNSISGRG